MQQYRLARDAHWLVKGRAVFVAQGYKLWPPPPNHCLPVEELMADCLWKEAASREDLVVLLRREDGAMERFTIPRGELRPLPEQVKALNFQLAVPLRNLAKEDDKRVQEFLKQLSEELHQGSQARAAQLHKALQELTAENLAAFDRVAEREKQATVFMQTIRDLSDASVQLANKRWGQWIALRDEVLALDCKILETSFADLAESVRKLDQIRKRMAVLWEKDGQHSPAEREELARLLQDLAERIAKSS